MKKPLVKKENLDRLLMLLPHLLKAEGNEWFKAAVKKLVRESDGSSVAVQDTLHSYSEVGDYYLIINPHAWLIDYDDIPDEKVRTQLKVDCFEMARNRLGRGNHAHTPDFDEFCRYAQMQIEELLNYFYNKKFPNIISSKEFIGKYYPTTEKENERGEKFLDSYKPKSDNSTKINQITFKHKSGAFFSYAKVSKNLAYTISKINSLRNKISHRSTSEAQNEDELINNFYKNNLNWKGKYKPFELQVIEFRRDKNWEEVVSAIVEIKTKVTALIKE